jgi:hypothetical protein
MATVSNWPEGVKVTKTKAGRVRTRIIIADS